MYISIRKKYYSISEKKWIDRPIEEIQEEHEARVSQSEATLWYNVILSALEDLTKGDETERRQAENFLSGRDGMLQDIADSINEFDADDQPFSAGLLQNPPTIKFNANVVKNLFNKIGPEGMKDLFKKKMEEYTAALLAENEPVVAAQSLSEAA